MTWPEGAGDPFDQGPVEFADLTDDDEEVLRQAGELPQALISELDADEADEDADEVDYNVFPTGSERTHGIITQAHRHSQHGGRLDLRGHDLGVIGARSLGILKQYSEIDLSDNKMKQLPEGFSALINIRVLDLSGNEFTEMPEQVLDLENLESLAFGYNKLLKIPPAMRRLRYLQEIDLSGCGLRDFPAALSSLQNLISLTMEANYISDVSPDFSRKSGLKFLSLERNGIETFPPNILRLQELSDLNLSYNSLDILPSDIDLLGSLEHLKLRGNSLSSLPSEIGRLQKIRTLDLGENSLTSLPGEIGELRQLQTLALDSNSLTDLPVQMAQLSPRIQLDLDGNPLPDLLESLALQGSAAIFSYLESLRESTPQYEAKLILIGEGGVGKSTLIAALRGEEFVIHRPTTHGIELGRLDLPHPGKAVTIRLNSWDFGGQDVYRITHQFFFSRRALYVLVWKPREGYEQGGIEEWCRRILLRTGADARILIVATHADERRPEFDYSYLRLKYPNVLVGNFEIDSESGRGLSELREAIAEAASRLPQMGELMSNDWSEARRRITSTDRPHISRLSFERMCAAESMDEESTQTLATLLHDLGHVIYYSDEEGLRDLVVLQPEWLTKAIGYVLEDQTARSRGGVLDHARLQEIWSGTGIKDAKGYPEEFHPYFLRLMEKFDITYRLPDEPASLVAQLVPYERPEIIEWEGLKRNSETRKLKLVCRTSDEAPGLIAWLTVRNHQFSVGRHWRRGVLLVHEAYGSQALLELAQNSRDLQLSVLGPAPEYFFHLLRDGIEELIRRRWKGLGYQFLIPCDKPLGDGRKCAGSFSYQALVRFRQRRELRIVCQACAEWSDVSELLTGFGEQSGPLDEMVANLARSQDANSKALQRLEIQAANSASLLRTALRVLSTEVSDTPRLFTLVPEDRSRIIRTVSPRQYLLLTLWCEQPGSEHRIDEAVYRFRPSKEWVESVGPYVRLIVKILQTVVPLAIAAYGVSVSPATLTSQRSDLDLTKVIADKLPMPTLTRDDRPDGLADGLTRAEGSGLRAFRQLLLKLDPVGIYGSLRRVRSTSGDLLWVCTEHHRHYDPGLPQLGYTQAAGPEALA